MLRRFFIAYPNGIGEVPGEGNQQIVEVAPIAIGAQYPDGQCTVWNVADQSMTVYQDAERAATGYGAHPNDEDQWAELVWIDAAPKRVQEDGPGGPTVPDWVREVAGEEESGVPSGC